MKIKKFAILKYSFYTALFALFIGVIYKSLVAVFSLGFISEEKYANNFYGYMVNSGNKLFTKSCYRYVKWNRFDHSADGGKVKDWIETAQGPYEGSNSGKGGLLLDGFPEHFPRTPLYYYSHNFHWNEKTFLPLRKEIVENENKKLEADELTGEKTLKEEACFFWTADVPAQMAKFLNDQKKYPDLKPQLKEFYDFLNNLNTPNHYGDDDLIKAEFNSNSKICQAVVNLLKSMKYEKQDKTDVKPEDVHNAFVKFGKVKADIMSRFLYSRGLYMLFFTCSDIDLKTNVKRIDNVSDKEMKERFKEIGDCYAYILSKAFKFGLDHKDSTTFGKIKKYFTIKEIEKIDKNDLEKKSGNLLNRLGEYFK